MIRDYARMRKPLNSYTFKSMKSEFDVFYVYFKKFASYCVAVVCCCYID